MLHLEEAEQTVDMQRYNMKSTQLYLTADQGERLYQLEVPNLSQGRPSIMMGDTVVVKNLDGGKLIFFVLNFYSYSNILTHSKKKIINIIFSNILDHISYSAFVKRVLNKFVHLSFHPKFHARLNDHFSVRFILARTQFRRMHQAVDTSFCDLGTRILFPKAPLRTKTPQVSVKLISCT